MTERISNARYGGLDDSAVYEACTTLLLLVAALPKSNDFQARRLAAIIPHETAVSLAQADPRTPLSDALYALAEAIDLYMHFQTPVGIEADDLRVALHQTLRD